LQYYATQRVYLSRGAGVLPQIEMRAPDGRPRGPRDWGELAPEQILPRIKHLYRLVRKPIYITEAGVPDPDDSLRPAYLARTLRAVWQACMHNYPVRGFFFWSLVDNFEWAEGYDPRFGLVYVDFRDQRRILKDSALWYADVIRTNGSEL